MLAVAARQAQSLHETEHRPWPAPERPWLLAETIGDQLFAHWPVPADALRPHLPEEVLPDTYDGEAWLGISAFAVTAVRLRGTLPLPLVSSFLQLNVRTYVTAHGAPGIWFFSLDVSSAPSLEVARRLFGLPFHRARISLHAVGDRFQLVCTRSDHPSPPKVFDARFEPVGPAASPRPGSLDHFLSERYRLYAERDGRLSRAEIHHRPWQLRQARGEIGLNTMAPEGVELDGEPLLHYSSGQDVLLWTPGPLVG
jgi:uncharacterized protein YqjF (DUF2071 family)